MLYKQKSLILSELCSRLLIRRHMDVVIKVLYTKRNFINENILDIGIKVTKVPLESKGKLDKFPKKVYLDMNTYKTDESKFIETVRTNVNKEIAVKLIAKIYKEKGKSTTTT